MKIKSLEELKQIKEENKNKVKLRSHSQGTGEYSEILIGMATCGISSGARETLHAFVEELSNEKIDNIKVIPVGCIGYCHSEPTVQVNLKGQNPVLYGNIKKEKVHELIEKHIKGGEPVKHLILDTHFETV